MRKQHRELRLKSAICLALGLITLTLYLPAAWHDFIQYDDQQYVTENPHVQAGLTGHGLAWAFGYHAGNWHPLTWLSHMLDCQFYGLNPAGHHLTNVLLHVASTILLFLVLNRMTRAIWRSACVAALFAWHPLHVESVAWVAERKDVLSAFFWMLTLGAYVKYVETFNIQSPKSKFWYGSALALFVLALMSKPMAVTLPFVLLLLDYWPLARRAEGGVRSAESSELRRQALQTGWLHLVLEKIPFIALSTVACVLTVAAQEQAIVSTAGLPHLQRIAHALVAYQHYLGAMFVPRHLAVFYPYDSTIATTKVAFSIAVLAFITLLAFRCLKRRPFLAIGWLWFLGSLVPVIGFVQVGEQAWADRYTYLPLIGLFVALIWGAVELAGNKPALRAAAGSAGLALLIATSMQLRHWKNTRSLFEHAAKVTRHNHMAVAMLGSLLAQEGKSEEAMNYYRTALSYKPGYPEVHFFIGNVLDQQDRLDEAIGEYTQALASKPIQERAHIFLAGDLAKQKKYDLAAAHYQSALKLNPESAVAHNNLARLRHVQGRLDDAIVHYSAAVKLNPKLAQGRNNLGILLLQKGRFVEGTAELREALRLNPDNAESQFNLALALNQQEQWGEAATLFAKTVGAASTDPNAHYQFALALACLGKSREAMSHYASALLIQPNFPDALAGLSWILATDSNPEFRNGAESVRMAEAACELTERKDPGKLKTLAAAYAEAKRFPEAVTTAQKALDLAISSGRKELAKECQIILEHFKSAEPWRVTKRGS